MCSVEGNVGNKRREMREDLCVCACKLHAKGWEYCGNDKRRLARRSFVGTIR